jgi:outer membrane protein OmpA-like peptidoglycan-associated protein
MRRLRKSGAWDKAGSHGRTVIALAATAVAGLAACSSTPKYANPVELYRSAAGFSLNDDTSGERNAQNLAAGSNEPYPNLGTVPPPPDRALSSIDRQKLQQGLTEDRTQAKQRDADLRGSGTAAPGAPTPITRPSFAANGDAAVAETKRKGEPSRPGARAGADSNAGTRHRTTAGSEPAAQETALNSPEIHALPEGDTPRPAPPPPSLPLPEKARKSPPDQASKATPNGTAAKRPAPASQTADMARPRPTAPATSPAEPAASVPPPPSDLMTSPPSKMAAVEPMAPPLPPAAAMTVPGASSLPPLGASDAKKPPSEPTAALDPLRPASAPEVGVGTPQPPAAAPAIPPADPAARIPPPPGDMMMPPPGKSATVEPMPAPATADSPPGLPPAAALSAPGASPLPPVGGGDAKKPPTEPTAALDPMRPPPPAPAFILPRAPSKTPEQQVALAPPSQSTPIIPLPAPVKTPEQQAAVTPPLQSTPTIPLPAPVKTPEQQAALLPSSQATPIIPLPAPSKTPEQQAALTPPPQATPRAPERDPAAAAPVPQPTGKGSTVSLQAAEINFAANGLTLTADDDRRLADVVKLYDKHGGVVRVVGYGRRAYGADAAQQELASFSKAIERANVVAKALAQLGLAANRIVVQAAPVGDGLGEDRAEVLLEF